MRSVGDGSDHIYLSELGPSGHRVPDAPQCTAKNGLSRCTLPDGHEGPEHLTCYKTRYVSGPVVARWDVGPVVLAGPDPARDARRRVYAERIQRTAARALDKYIEIMFEPEASSIAVLDAGEAFVEAVGDYVEQRLHHNRHYGATPDDWCECDWLGAGTPRHRPSPMCIALRPAAPRSGPAPVVCSELPACHDGEHSASCEVSLHVPRVEGPSSARDVVDALPKVCLCKFDPDACRVHPLPQRSGPAPVKRCPTGRHCDGCARCALVHQQPPADVCNLPEVLHTTIAGVRTHLESGAPCDDARPGLGGQGPCPLKEHCVPGACAITGRRNPPRVEGP